MVNLAAVKACPECGSTSITYERDKEEIICQECGNIFAQLNPDDEHRFEEVSDVI